VDAALLAMMQVFGMMTNPLGRVANPLGMGANPLGMVHPWVIVDMVPPHVVVVDPWVKVEPAVADMHLNMEMNTPVDMVTPYMVVHPWVKVKM